MNDEIIYTDEPMELGDILEDFLPYPDQLIPNIHKVKYTVELNEETIRFFQAEAEKKHISYQEIISLLVNKYAQERQTSQNC